MTQQIDFKEKKYTHFLNLTEKEYNFVLIMREQYPNAVITITTHQGDPVKIEKGIEKRLL
jgi:hypothetical protein